MTSIEATEIRRSTTRALASSAQRHAEWSGTQIPGDAKVVALRTEWTVLDATPRAPHANETTVDTVPDGEVIWGYAHTATTIQFTVFRTTLTQSNPSFPHVSDPPCSTS